MTVAGRKLDTPDAKTKAVQEVVESRSRPALFRLSFFSLNVPKWKETRNVKRLVRALRDHDPDVRAAAAAALGEIGDPSAASSLLSAFGTDAEDDVRQAAEEALVRLGPSTEPAIETAILAGARLPSLPRLAVRIGGFVGARLLASMWTRHVNYQGDVRDLLVQTTGPALERLLSVIAHVRPGVARKFFEILGKNGDPQVVPWLVNQCQMIEEKAYDLDQFRIASGDEWEAVRTIRRILIELGGAAVPSLIRLTGSASSSVRARVLDVLGQIRDERALEVIVGSIGDASPEVADCAESALKRFGATVTPAVLALLSQGPLPVQLRAVRILGSVGDERCVAPLFSMLGNQGDLRRELHDSLWKVVLRQLDEQVRYWRSACLDVESMRKEVRRFVVREGGRHSAVGNMVRLARVLALAKGLPEDPYTSMGIIGTDSVVVDIICQLVAGYDSLFANEYCLEFSSRYGTSSSYYRTAENFWRVVYDRRD